MNDLALQLEFPDKAESVDALIDRENPAMMGIQRALAMGPLTPVILDLKVQPGWEGLAVEVDSFVQPLWFVSEPG